MSYQSLPLAVQRLLDKMRWVLATYAKDYYADVNAELGPSWGMRPPKEILWADPVAIGLGPVSWDQLPLLQVWENSSTVVSTSAMSQDVLYDLSISVWEITDGISLELVERRAKLSVHIIAELFSKYLPDNPTSLAGPCGIWKTNVSNASLGSSRRFVNDANAIAHRCTISVGLRTSRPFGNTLLPVASLPVPTPEMEQTAALQDATLYLSDGVSEVELGTLLAGRVVNLVASLSDPLSFVVKFDALTQLVTPADGAVVILVAQNPQKVVTGVVTSGQATLALTGVADYLFDGDVTVTVADAIQNVVLSYRVRFSDLVWTDTATWNDDALWGAP
jgi:hypothetical protein